MAIARVTHASGFENDAANNYSISYTVASGSNRLLVGTIYIQDGTFTSFVYNSVNLTQDNTKADPGNANNRNFLFSLLAPDQTTANATYTKSSSVGLIVMCLANYTGVKQSAQPDSIGSASSSSATGLSYSVTTVADGCWIMTVVNNTAGGSITSGTNCTVLEAPFTTNGVMCDSNGSVGAAGSKTVSMTGSSGRWWSASASYAPAITANGNMLIFM